MISGDSLEYNFDIDEEIINSIYILIFLNRY